MPKILIADDNSNIQKMVALAFEDHKIEVVAVGNGEAAVKKLPDVKPDLILADVFMPVRNGYEVCEFVKKDARYSSIPVILLVGAFDPLDEAEAKRVAADGVLKKPFVPPDPLISLVTGLLSKVMKAAPAAKGKEEAPAAQPPSLMPRKPQSAPVQPVSAYGESSADDDAYLMGKGRDADDDKWQTVTSSHQEGGPAAGFESSAVKVFSGLAAETADDHFGETHAEARRRQEVDNQAVPSFSSALVGEMEEQKAEDRSQEKRSVVPNPQAEAQPETNWAALVKSFTAAPLSISEPVPVKQADEPALEHMIDQVSGPAEAKKFAADVAEPQVSAYVADPAGEGEAERPERVDAKSSSSAAASSGSSASAGAAAKAESSAKAEATRSYEEKNSAAETSAYGQEPEIQSAVTVSPIQAKVLAQVEASVRAAEVNEKPAFDESLWAKMAMQTSLPAEPPFEEYESRSNTAAQMIAAAAEAAQEYSQRGSGFPFVAPGESQATVQASTQATAQTAAQATAVKTAPAKVEAPAVVESAPAVGYAEVVPSPREVPHVFKASEEKASAAAVEAVVDAPAEAKAQAPVIEVAPIEAVESATRTDGESTHAEVLAAQEVEAQQSIDQPSEQRTEQAVIPPNVDEIVARVLERIAPQLQELISKGVIKPLVEEAMRQPESPKKK